MAVTSFCTDEDLLVRSPADAGVLRPAGSRLAAGTDGVFQSGTRWLLRSASSDFVGQGVAQGHAVLLEYPDDPSAYGSGGEPYVVESVASDGLTLRHAGFGATVGLPPGPAAGRTGVHFVAYTYAPQIESASYRINQLFGVDDSLPGREASKIYDSREIRELCLLIVLERICRDAWTNSRDDIWKEKAASYASEIDRTLPTLTLRWGTQGRDSEPTSRRQGRVSR